MPKIDLSQPPPSHIAALLRKCGIGTTISLRQAAGRTGVSRETFSNLMKEPAQPRSMAISPVRLRALRAIAEGFGLPWELVRRCALADRGLEVDKQGDFELTVDQQIGELVIESLHTKKTVK